MLKNSFQKGAVQISTFAGMAIIAAVVVVVSTIAVIKYREAPSITAPVAVITPKLTPSATLTPDETADWQTYKNDQYGFILKYPQSVSFSSTEESLAIKIIHDFKDEGFSNTYTTYTGDYIFQISIISVPKNTDFQKWWRENNPICLESEPLCFYPASYKPKKVELNGYTAFKSFIPFDGYGDPSVKKTAYDIQKENYIYDITVTPTWEENVTITNQILSTFKFTK